jgi:hypothetical protein
MPPVGFQPTIPASEQPQTDALDRAATGTGDLRFYITNFYRQTFLKQYSLILLGVQSRNQLQQHFIN